MESQEERQEARIEGDDNRVSQTRNHQPVTLSVTLAAPERASWLSIQSVRIEVNLQPLGVES